ncbi:imidazolonepropionase [Endozoicomonas montiporae]|uniref:Imidazolonepropionase n=1 Tax=Endozoicomonas montiporae TaxID=1027273 RepID=A0A081N7F0_9GAMM|nr:imidazolonepropionase [Endozoicomonas montiporae]
MKDCNRVWINVNLATFDPSLPDAYGIHTMCALGILDGRIACIQPMSSVTATSLPFDVIDGHNGWLTPGLIDCHTHLVFAGNRANEFEQRQQGKSYQEIARQGGGILSTVRATRVRSKEQLIKSSLPRLQALVSEGVTTIEIKSGYGLNLPDEIKMLEVARELGKRVPVRVKTTLLAAHALPPEFAGRPNDYIDLVCKEIIPAVAEQGLADAVDVFSETIGFDLEQSERVFRAALAHNLPIKGHTEQLSLTRSSSLAASLGALSCDHLEYLDEAGAINMAESGTVAVLLPGAFYYLRGNKKPPIELLRRFKVPMAVASDVNPGSSPMASIRLMMNMSCILFQLSAAEAVAGATREAAKALGMIEDIGTIEVGKIADLCLWDTMHPNELPYELGQSPLLQRIIGGEIVYER